MAAAVFVLTAAATALVAQYASNAEHPAIAYSRSAPTDAVARLQESVERGDTVLEFDQERGYLPSVLRALNVPVSSQSLVFSRTSLQVDRIAPWTPRALYFNDQVYVGWATACRLAASSGGIVVSRGLNLACSQKPKRGKVKDEGCMVLKHADDAG